MYIQLWDFKLFFILKIVKAADIVGSFFMQSKMRGKFDNLFKNNLA